MTSPTASPPVVRFVKQSDVLSSSHQNHFRFAKLETHEYVCVQKLIILIIFMNLWGVFVALMIKSNEIFIFLLLNALLNVLVEFNYLIMRKR